MQTPAPQPLDSLYGWTYTRPDGHEALIVVADHNITNILLSSDLESALSLQSSAESAVAVIGGTATLIRFDRCEVMRSVKPPVTTP